MKKFIFTLLFLTLAGCSAKEPKPAPGTVNKLDYILSYTMDDHANGEVVSKTYGTLKLDSAQLIEFSRQRPQVLRRIILTAIKNDTPVWITFNDNKKILTSYGIRSAYDANFIKIGSPGKNDMLEIATICPSNFYLNPKAANFSDLKAKITHANNLKSIKKIWLAGTCGDVIHDIMIIE